MTPGRKLRLIYIVRDPIRRIESYWAEKLSHGDLEIHHDFNKAVRESRECLIDVSRITRKQLDNHRQFTRGRPVLVLFFGLRRAPSLRC